MNEKVALKFIKQLKNDPERFTNEGRAYQLLQEYFAGFSIETLRELLCSQNNLIRQTALWIVSELGEEAGVLLKEVVPHMDDDDRQIAYYALEIVADIADGEYLTDFIRVFTFLEHSDPQMRLSVMLIVSGLSVRRIHEAYRYAVKEKMSNAPHKKMSNDTREKMLNDTYEKMHSAPHEKILNASHEKGLLSLINMNELTASSVTMMINADDALIRKYGAIAAVKLYKKYPGIINEGVHSDDFDIKELSRTVVQAKAEEALIKSLFP
ncbi:MAG: hypothetical protein LBV33_09110 [Lachnospiraceae bacterium]|nr:hypothetical protein [Lachnospiraceae bacterium]